MSGSPLTPLGLSIDFIHVYWMNFRMKNMEGHSGKPVDWR